MIKEPIKTLPEKPSELLELALSDLAAVEADRRYTVDMASWHEPCEGSMKRCLVCLAGAVMSKSLNARPDLSILPRDFEHRGGRTVEGLRDLDYLRRGVVPPPTALTHQQSLDRYVTPYEEDREAWWRDMRKFVVDLRQAGI